MNEVTITVSGRVGSGKSAVCGEIEILCRALGLQVKWIGGRDEKNLTGADWIHEIEMYKPVVKIVEQIESAAPSPAAREAGDGVTEDQLLDLVVALAPKHEYRDPDDGTPCFSALGFARDLARALLREAK
jgi:hypothetical protein